MFFFRESGLPLHSLGADIRRELFELVANGFAEKCEAIATILAEEILDGEMRTAFVQNVKGALLNGDNKADVLLQSLNLWYRITQYPNGQVLHNALGILATGNTPGLLMYSFLLDVRHNNL